MVGFLSKLAASVVLAAVVTDGLAAQRSVPPRPVSPTPAPAGPVGVPVVPLPGQTQPGTQPETQPGPQSGAMAGCGIAAAEIPFNDDPTIGTIARSGRDAREAIKTVRALDWSKTVRQAERASKNAGGRPILLIQAYGDLAGVT